MRKACKSDWVRVMVVTTAASLPETAVVKAAKREIGMEGGKERDGDKHVNILLNYETFACIP